MSTIYNDSILVKDKVYVVQDILKLGRDTKRFVGLKATFHRVVNSTAEARITGTMQEISARSLIKVKGYTARPVRSENADGFAVGVQNSLGLPVGRAYLNPVKTDDTHAWFELDGREVKIPLDILISLVKDKEVIDKDTQKERKKISKNVGISQKMLDALDNPEARKDSEDPLPMFIERFFPNLNVKDVMEEVRKEEKLVHDYDGNLHTSIIEADKANALLRNKYFADLITKIVAEEVKHQLLKRK